MAYLKNENGEIIVDAILTKYGRDKLARQGNLNVTKFSLSDDEVDYSLYNVNNPNGSEFYDVAIRQLPVLETLPGDDVALRYHLFTDTNQNVSTISNLTATFPAEFTTGLSTRRIAFPITPVLTPIPTDYSSIYFVAQLTDTAGVNYELKGITDAEIGDTNQILEARQQLSTLNKTRLEKNRPIEPINTNNTVYAVGHYFTFKLLSLPRYARVFTVKITAYGPVNTNSYSFNININGAYRALATT